MENNLESRQAEMRERIMGRILEITPSRSVELAESGDEFVSLHRLSCDCEQCADVRQSRADEMRKIRMVDGTLRFVHRPIAKRRAKVRTARADKGTTHRKPRVTKAAAMAEVAAVQRAVTSPPVQGAKVIWCQDCWVNNGRRTAASKTIEGDSLCYSCATEREKLLV